MNNKKKIKNILQKAYVTKNIMHGWNIYPYYKNSHDISKKEFIKKNWKRFYVEPICKNKSEQIARFMNKIDIVPVKSEYFFYSIDTFKALQIDNHILDNYSVDYRFVINGSLNELKEKLKCKNSEFAINEIKIIDALYKYFEKVKSKRKELHCTKEQIEAIESLFFRPALTFFEGLQRVLFYNQFLWQTGHKHNGFGHLDWLLIDLYYNDLKNNIITDEIATKMLEDFFLVLHENCWYKSTMLLGDTGQIIILGGKNSEDGYNCNVLTFKFIEVSKKLKLPDPKVLLRCTSNMPKELLELALECIATGIGAPFLSNDDAVIPALIDFGYEVNDAYNYATAACWEPLILNNSCDQNNIRSINYAEPLVELFEDKKFDDLTSVHDILLLYEKHLKKYLNNVLEDLSHLKFEEDPMISMLSESAINSEKDIVRGGAKYSNLGLTSVGMLTVVNSILNIKKLVFEEKIYTIKELNQARKKNFIGFEEILDKLKNAYPGFGNDCKESIELTKYIQKLTSHELKNYKTHLGGNFKVGLSSPNYIVDAFNTKATLDGRLDGEPFNVHISSIKSLPATELLSFAMQLDYNDNRINGNVVDFMVTPAFLRENMTKFVQLLLKAFKGGLYQLQMNVVDSQTLIDAKKNPRKFSNLVVRVWGFSAYFNDLPEEYKDLLIMRAIESEKSNE